jgi:hypothetical protein
MRHIVLRLLLVLSSIFIVFDIAEFTVRSVKPQMTFEEAVQFADFYLSSDSLIPFSLRKNYSGTMREYNGDYTAGITTNSFGYRGQEFTLDKPKETKRILILGDSMTFGIGVKDTETYPFQLGELLKKNIKSPYEVINAGYADGFSPDSYYLYLKERGMKLQPDIIVVGLFVWNDITDLTETVWKSVDGEGLPTRIESCCRIVDSGALRNKSIAFKYRYPWIRESHLFLLAVNTLKDRFNILLTPMDLVAKRDYAQGCILDPNCIDTFKTEEEKVYKLLSKMKAIAENGHSKFIVLVLPVDFQLYPTVASAKYGSMAWSSPPDDTEFLQKRIIGRLSVLGIESLDMYPVFDRKRDLPYPFFPHNAHYNAIGNGIIAESLYSAITAK